MVSGVGLGMGVLDLCGYRRSTSSRGTVWGVKLGRPIVINGAFATRLFSNYFGDLFISATCHISMSLLCYEIDVHL